MREEEIDAMDYGNESEHDLISMKMLEKFVTEVSLILTLIEDKHVIKYVIVLGKDNQNEKEHLKLCKTWEKVYTRYLRLL